MAISVIPNILHVSNNWINVAMNNLVQTSSQLLDVMFFIPTGRIMNICLMQVETNKKDSQQGPALSDLPQWFVLRDLKRWNSNNLAWKTLAGEGLEVFTPLCWKVSMFNNKRIRRQVPVIPDLLFVYAPKVLLDKYISKIPTLQYRLTKTTKGCPMTVRDADMRKFINAISSTPSVHYYKPEEVEEKLKGRHVRIIGGPLNGMCGSLITVRGSKVKRLFVSIPGIVAAGVEVNPEFIEIIHV